MNRAAFDTQLAGLYTSLLERCLRLTGNDDDAGDLANDTCLRAIEHIQMFDGSNMRGWLFKIARNIFLNNMKAKKLVQVDVVDDCLPEDGLTIMEPRHEITHAGIAYDKALASLSSIHRETFLLAEEGLSLKEISERLGIPVGTVKSRLFTARNRIKDAL